jgi:hypothetical protein
MRTIKGEKMMKIISFIHALFGPHGDAVQHEVPDWIHDPLAHPALGAMSERELGDLPFNRGCCAFRDGSLSQEACS